MTTTATESHDVLLPSGADYTSTWEDWSSQFRLVYTPTRLLDDDPTVGCWAAVVQYPDGSIGGDDTEGRPEITVQGGDGITRAQALALAASILATVDQLDGWVER